MCSVKSNRRDVCEDYPHPGSPVGYLSTQNVYTSHRDKIQLQSTQVTNASSSAAFGAREMPVHFPSPPATATARTLSCPLCPAPVPASCLLPVQQHLSQPSLALQQQLLYPWAAMMVAASFPLERNSRVWLLHPHSCSCFNGGKTCNRRTFGEALKNKQPLPNTTSGGDLQSSQEVFLKGVLGLCYYGFHTLPV